MRRRESQQSLEENRIWSLCFYDKINELRRGVLMHAILPLVKYEQARVRRVCRPVLGGQCWRKGSHTERLADGEYNATYLLCLI